MRRLSALSVAIATTGALAIGVAACGDDSSSTSGTIIRGTTDQPVSYDPAGAYDLPSYDAIYNVYQNLMQFPPGARQARAGGGRVVRLHRRRHLRVHAQGRTHLLRRLGSDRRGRRLLVRAQRRDRRPERRLLAAREHEERRGAGRQDGRLQPQGARRDLALADRRGVVRDRPLRRVPEGQAAVDSAEVIGSGPLRGRRLRARPADRAAGQPRVQRATTRRRSTRRSCSTSTRRRR